MMDLSNILLYPPANYTRYGLEGESFERLLPKQSLDFEKIASLKSTRNDGYKITRNEHILALSF